MIPCTLFHDANTVAEVSNKALLILIHYISTTVKMKKKKHLLFLDHHHLRERKRTLFPNNCYIIIDRSRLWYSINVRLVIRETIDINSYVTYCVSFRHKSYPLLVHDCFLLFLSIIVHFVISLYGIFRKALKILKMTCLSH